MADKMTPFRDDRTSVQVGGITIENGTERISISGTLDLTRDRQALERAKALRSTLDAIINALESARELPSEAPEPETARIATAKNPFA